MTMTIHSPIMTTLLVIFATIGVLAVLAVFGMLFMHAGMMNMMGPNMLAACQGMMATPP